MGGNALKNTNTIRFSLEEYNRISKIIMEKLKNDGIIASIPYHVYNKNSFGDLDVLIEKSDNINIYDWIIENFNPSEIVDNSTISFSFQSNANYYQIDFTPVTSINSAMFYFSYGDIGAIIGRFTNFHGLKFSENGISIVIKEIHLKSNEINLTNNVNKICDELNLDYEKWKHFGNFEEIEIFKWLISSDYFTIDAFKFIPMDKRKRLKIRPMYQRFLDYIGIGEYENIENKISVDSNKEKLIEKYNKTKELEIIKNQILKDKERKNKFNANHFIEFGIENVELGKNIKAFKSYILETNNDFDTWIDENTIDQIIEAISKFLSTTFISLNY